MDEKTDRYGVVDSDVIDDGMATDAYFLRTEETLDWLDHNPQVFAEVTADQFADEHDEVLAGVQNVIELLSNTDVTVWSLPEGSVFDGGPVMYIEGNYRDFARYETELLGMLSEASGYATKARELVEAAGETSVLSFGSRHNHPATAAIMERAAYIGGVDGYSNIAASDDVPEDPSGTMPHALMLSCDTLNSAPFDEKKQARLRAWNAFNQGVDDDVPRIVLADTWDDEVREVKDAACFLGDDLDGVRLDTTGSRRGDFEAIIREVRYELDAIGREDVDIFVSGGLGVEELEELRDLVDGFGVGSAISDAPSVDFGLDIVQVEGDDVSKRGKLPGVKGYDDMRLYIKDGKKINGDRIKDARNRALQGIDSSLVSIPNGPIGLVGSVPDDESDNLM